MENSIQIELNKHKKLFPLERKTQQHIYHSFSAILKLSLVQIRSIWDLLSIENHHSMNT